MGNDLRLLTFSIDPALNGYSTERGRRLQQDLLERLRQTPGIESAATSEIQVLTNSNMGGNITVEDYQPAPGEHVGCSYNGVSPGYFQTMGMPLLQGREFNDFDRADSGKVAIVNEAAGALAAAAASRYIESQLFGVTAQDPVIFLAAAALLAAAGVLSAFIPARRASGLHPTDVLRYE